MHSTKRIFFLLFLFVVVLVFDFQTLPTEELSLRLLRVMFIATFLAMPLGRWLLEDPPLEPKVGIIGRFRGLSLAIWNSRLKRRERHQEKKTVLNSPSVTDD